MFHSFTTKTRYIIDLLVNIPFPTLLREDALLVLYLHLKFCIASIIGYVILPWKSDLNAITNSEVIFTYIVLFQDAKKNDELDEQNGVMETNLQNALDAYCPPCLRPVDFEVEESCSTQPLISPKWLT